MYCAICQRQTVVHAERPATQPVLHGAPTGTIQKLQRVQNNAVRIVLQESRRSHAKPLLHQLHCLPVQHRITCKLAVLRYKVLSTSTPVYMYLHCRIAKRACSRTLRSSAIPLHPSTFSFSTGGQIPPLTIACGRPRGVSLL